MGCSAAKNLTVEPLNATKITQLSNNHVDEIRKVSIPRRESDIPAIVSDEPLTEMLDGDSIDKMHHTQNGLSFEIPFEEESPESIIRKHPPKRFQKLEEQQTSPTLSLVKLQEKLDEAEIRRQQILQQRIQSAKYRQMLRKQASVTSSTDENYADRLKVPQDVPTLSNPYDVSYI